MEVNSGWALLGTRLHVVRSSTQPHLILAATWMWPKDEPANQGSE